MSLYHIRLGEIITPSYYIVATKHSKQITQLTNVLRTLQLAPISFKLKRKTFVVAWYEYTYERAVVLSDSVWNGKEWMHHLLLVDRGKFLDTVKAWEAPEKAAFRRPLNAFQFYLDGIVPKCEDATSPKWSQEAYDRVNRILTKKSMEIKLRATNARPDGVVFGDIFIREKSLSEYLLKHNLAVRDVQRFSESIESLYGDVLGANEEYTNHKSRTTSSSEESFITADDGSETSKTPESPEFDLKQKIPLFYEQGDENAVESLSDESEPDNFSHDNVKTGAYRILVRKPEDEPALIPISSIRKLSLSCEVRKTLKSSGKKELFPTGAYAFPAIARGRSTAIIGGSGKTFSSVYGVLDQVFKLKTDEIPDGNGPLAIFICGSSKSAGMIFQKCLECASFSDVLRPRIKCILGSNEKKEKVNVGNGCEVLISTPHCLVRILKNTIYTNLKRLRWVVIDEAAKLLEPPFLVEMMIFREYVKKPIQWIVLSTCWTPTVKKFIKWLKDPILLITCHLEASVYANVRQTIATIEINDKLPALVEWLGDHKQERTAVVCSISELSDVAAGLVQCGLATVVAESSMNFVQLAAIKREWDQMRRGVLVCCDSVLQHINFDAACLVNYSIPHQKDAFFVRYSLMMKYFPDHYSQEQPTVKAEALTFIDDSNDAQLTFLVNFFQRFHAINPSLLEKAEEMNRKREESKRNVPLCDYIMARGVCVRSKCNLRHVIFPDIDSADAHLKGTVVFHRVVVQNGDKLWVQLISAEDAVGNKVNFADLTEDLKNSLQEYFSDNEREALARVEEGERCAYCHDGEYLRVEVVSVLKSTINLLFIDSGRRKTVEKTAALMVLPEELKCIPAQAIKMQIANIVPVDFDEIFDEQSIKILKKLFSRPLEKNQQWRANVRIAFKSALIVDNVCICSWMDQMRSFHETGITVAQELISNGLAIKNEKHLPLLMDMCAKAGFVLPAAPEKKVQVCLKPKWAFLEIDTAPAVHVSLIESTHQVYLVNQKFVNQLKDVEKLCEAEGDALLEKGVKPKIRAGLFCLAVTDGAWNRARIEKVMEQTAMCFMVDHGDTCEVELTKIVPISAKLVDQLPFQAIECILGGVKFSDSEEFVNYFYDLSAGGNWVLGEVVNEKPKLTGGHLYKIKLLSFEGSCLNGQLVKEGILEADDESNSAEFLQDSETVQTGDNDSESDLEGSKDEEQELPEDWSVFNNLPDDLKDELETMFDEQVNYELRKLTENEEKNVEEHIEDSCKETELTTKMKMTELQLREEKVADPLVQEDEGDECVCIPKGLNAKVYWCQNQRNIILKILVPGVREKVIWAGHRYICVKLTNSLGSVYVTRVRFFGIIAYPYIRTHIGPSSFDIYCPKRGVLPWPRLTLDPKPSRNLKYDPDAVIADNDFDVVTVNKPKRVPDETESDQERIDEEFDCYDFEKQIDCLETKREKIDSPTMVVDFPGN